MTTNPGGRTGVAWWAGAVHPVPPVRIDLGDVVLRRWEPDDAAALAAAAAAALDHLSPWMIWATPEGATERAMATFIAETTARSADGSEVVYGVFDAVDGAVLGGTGLHDRLGAGRLEIGYWLAPTATGRGLMTRIAALLTDLALDLDGITTVEIHCDEANERSAAIPRRLGYRLAGVVESDRPQAPADTGRDMIWVRREPVGAAPSTT
jgi:RimJ/RimL family protein N-acetyltransferase